MSTTAVPGRFTSLPDEHATPGTPAADEASAEMAEARQSGRAGPRG